MEKIEVTSLGDSKRKFLPFDLCDVCLNDGEDAKKCKLNKDGKCNYIPKNKDIPNCHLCGYSTPYKLFNETRYDCSIGRSVLDCNAFIPRNPKPDPVNNPNHYTGSIECIDYLRDKLTPEEFVGFCIGNVLKYTSRWRKKDGVQDLKKAEVYLKWAIEAEENNGG